MIAPLGALLLSTLLAQMQPAATASPATSPDQNGAPQSPVSSPDPGGYNVRRPPGSAPRMNPPPAAPGSATIRNSGSTNTASYVIVVHPDFSADVTVDGTSEVKAVNAPQARWLFAKLRAAMPLDAMLSAHCVRSVSFGSSTTIEFEGKMTPDLGCSTDPAARELGRTVGVIVMQLRISPLRHMDR